MEKFRKKMVFIMMAFYSFNQTTNPALYYKAPSGLAVGENSYSSNL